MPESISRVLILVGLKNPTFERVVQNNQILGTYTGDGTQISRDRHRSSSAHR